MFNCINCVKVSTVPRWADALRCCNNRYRCFMIYIPSVLPLRALAGSTWSRGQKTKRRCPQGCGIQDQWQTGSHPLERTYDHSKFGNWAIHLLCQVEVTLSLWCWFQMEVSINLRNSRTLATSAVVVVTVKCKRTIVYSLYCKVLEGLVQMLPFWISFLPPHTYVHTAYSISLNLFSSIFIYLNALLMWLTACTIEHLQVMQSAAVPLIQPDGTQNQRSDNLLQSSWLNGISLPEYHHPGLQPIWEVAVVPVHTAKN